MKTISESELSLVVQSKALKHLHITQNEQGRFLVNAALANQEGDRALITSRKTPREWASLDRLTRHIHQRYGAIPSITLSLHSGEASK